MQRIKKNLPYILCFLVAFVFGMKQLREPDIWWQLLSGRWMLEHGQITHRDMFSFTMQGHKWVNVKWLYEIIIAIIEKILGPEGVILLQSVVNVAIVYLLFRILKLFRIANNEKGTRFFAIISALLFLTLVEYRMAGRPEMISHLMCTLFLFLLWQFPRMEWKQIIWFLPLQCLWANMHEGYPVGLVMIGTVIGGSLLAYLIKKDRVYLQQTIRSLVLFLASVCIILLNPNGFQLWKQPFEIYRQVWANKYTTELFSFKDPEYWTIQAKIHVALLAAVCLFWLFKIFQSRKRKVDFRLATPTGLTYLLLIPLFGYLSLTANRNIPFAQIILFPSVVVMLDELFIALKPRRFGFYKPLAANAMLITSAICIAMYIWIVSNVFYKNTHSPNRYGIHVSMLHNPTGAANFIQQNKIGGLPFSDYFVSSYMLWDMYPRFKSYIDLRDLDVFPSSFFDDYFSLYAHPEKFYKLDSTYNFNYIVLSTSQLTGLQTDLYWGSKYNLIYVDPVSCVYLKINEANKPINNNRAIQKIFSWPPPIEDPSWAGIFNILLNPSYNNADEDPANAPIYSAQFQKSMRNYPTAIQQLAPVIGNFENNADAYSTLGNTYAEYASVIKDPLSRQRMLDTAGIYLNEATEIDKNKPEIYKGLANVAIMKNDYEDADDYLDKYLSLDNKNDFMYFLSGNCARFLWKKTGAGEYRKKVIRQMKHSIALNPRNGKAYLFIAEAYYGGDDKDEARDNLKKFIQSGNQLTPDEQTLFIQLKQQLGIQ